MCEIFGFGINYKKSENHFFLFVADIRKFFHTILENPHFVTDPRTLEGENQNGPLDTPVPREKTLKSGKSG